MASMLYTVDHCTFTFTFTFTFVTKSMVLGRLELLVGIQIGKKFLLVLGNYTEFISLYSEPL